METLEVYDLDRHKYINFDKTGLRCWGPVICAKDVRVPPRQLRLSCFEPRHLRDSVQLSLFGETLYHRTGGHWTLISDAQFSGYDDGCYRRVARRITPLNAAKWLKRNGFREAYRPAESDSASQSPVIKYLGLVVNDRRVRRDGYGEEASLGRKEKAWLLFKFLLDAGESGLPRADLLTKIWPDGDVTPNALDQRKRDVNRILEPIRVEITTDNHGTWRLQHF